MFAQSGWFTIHGTRKEPIEEIFLNRPDIIKRVKVPASAIPAAKEFLALAGITHRQLFPNLDGLARSIKQHFAVS